MDKLKLNQIQVALCFKVAAEVNKVNPKQVYEKVVDTVMDLLKVKLQQEGCFR